MDTDSFAFSFSPSQCSVNDLKPFSKEIDLIARDPSQEIFSGDNEMIKWKKTLESQDTGIDETVLSGREASYFRKKHWIHIEQNNRDVQSEGKNNLGDFKSV